MASFGPQKNAECGQKPGGFTRLTLEVLDWVNSVTTGNEMELQMIPVKVSIISDAGKVNYSVGLWLHCTVH